MNENEAWSLTQNGYSEHGNGGISHKQDDQSRRAGVNWCESPAAGGSARRGISPTKLWSQVSCLFPLCLGWWSKMTNMFRRLKPTSNLKGAVVVIHSVGFHKVNVWISDPDAEISSGNAPEWFTRHARFQFTGTELEDGLESLLTQFLYHGVAKLSQSHATGFLDNSVHILRMESCDILENSIGDRAAMNYLWHPMATWEHLPQYQVLSHNSRGGPEGMVHVPSCRMHLQCFNKGP